MTVSLVASDLCEKVFLNVFTGIPLVIVSLVLIVDKDAYGNAVPGEDVSVHQSTDPL